MDKTSTGLEQNVAGLLCYVVGWITGLIFFIIEKENRFVKFHAMQSIITFGALSIIQLIWGAIISNILIAINWRMVWFTGLVGTLLWLVNLALVIFLVYKAYNNEMYKLPVIGAIAEQQAEKFSA